MTIHEDVTDSPADWEDFWYDSEVPTKQEMETATKLVQMYFTEDEWDAIYAAMADYQDHGEEEAEISYEIQSKITRLFAD